ncbi:ABC transporter substrate-binding protein [Actinocorallia sp. A-T 12471]|uniref:ABC transporter substrate-binding protein n=1 Tax=Actinocorallia sp. A-T 12471 TaxID=3089813 RepID=UPI0029CE97A1|nr:ABC transporter substrate-binding protein [Actinocorallia sp. A-T 12471]MDX6740091.1 ABC transporter substrate-binding protein [Actinocorallia sp. A-T 12471]
MTLAPVALAVAAALALSACGGSAEQGADAAASGTLAANWGGFPESWAPGAEMEAGYMRVPYENLVGLNTQGEITPVLATAWKQTDAALTLTLREGVVFHDGTPFDAEAVKVNLESIRDGNTPYAGPLKVISSIDVVDATTVKLNLRQPTPSLLTTLSTRAVPIASPKAIADKSVAQHPVGTGPWAYDPASSTAGTRMTFKYFDKYWDGRDSVGFDAVELYAIPDDNAAAGALISGEIDVTDTEVPNLDQLKATAGIKTLSYPAIRNNPMFFDRGPGGVFADVRVRQAACYALDTAALQKLEPDWVPRTQHFAEGESGYNAAIAGYPTDLAKAKQLMSEAGNPKVSAEVVAAPFNQKQLQVYAAQLKEIGIAVKVQVAPPPQYFSTWNSGRFPLGLGGNDELTPFDWYQAWFAADAPGNPAGVESAELKAAADKAIAAGTSPEAEGLWGDVTRIISEEALTCGHVAGEELIAWHSDRVDGVAAPTQPWETNLIDYKALRPKGA